ncbi:MAG: rRNA pseudouridine synthase [Ruminococcaceae bacterium]|nr:rRNA pseudouridine synthase [Oscillospiraceae bacterium]
MRLDKYIVACGVASRKEAAQAVRRKGVTVNGTVASSPDMKIDENSDKVVFCGEELVYQKYIWIMMNKPQGVISATEDARGQKTVIDLLPERLQRMELFPCGRLDGDTTGLMLITNEGELAHRLLSPKRHVDKVYRFESARRITEEEIEKAAEGLVLGDGYECLPADIVADEEGCGGRITLREGKYHQIKRMFGAMDNRITGLKRVKFAEIELDPSLAPGEWRYLADHELALLRNH